MTHPKVKLILEVLLFVYTTSIVLGRLYCGMHGFFDVFIGSVLGAILSLVQWFYGDALDHFIYTGSFTAPIIVTLIILLLVRVHPEPADDCPCFDDSVAFAGVAIGAELGYWHYSHSGLAWDFPVPATTPFQLEVLGWPKTIARIAVGIVMILAWREVMKPTLLRLLPPVFRVVEKLGLSLPRKFFVQASEYKRVPKHLKDDDMMPSVSEIPSLLTSMRHPRRTRSVSVGPQSEADAYETMAYREKRRKEDASSFAANTTADFRGNLKNDSPGYFGMNTSDHSSDKPPISGLLPTPASSNVDLYRQMLGTDPVLYTPLTPNSEKAIDGSNSHRGSEDRRRYEKEEREMFSNLEKPRVRYDVEVITKLIVYAGIALIAVEGGPVVFDIIGLGFGKQTA
ncbi:hypothetical protein MMC12_001505 [Toensbergia leucococca]|nr:hypothetical protein [Toensbergia leucococca]